MNMKKLYSWAILLLLAPILLVGCGLRNDKAIENSKQKFETISSKDIPIVKINQSQTQKNAPEGMVWISGAVFNLGAVVQDKMAMKHEKPSNIVSVDGFYMDIHEVTNAQFKKFVDETGYITTAERELEWEEMKKQLPAGTPKPHDSIMKPGSLTFMKTKNSVPNLYDFSQWWNWTVGANWRQPHGANSSIERKEDFPVVHIAYEDALAYCKWIGRRLPTETEWELAARGKQLNSIHFWGDDVTKLGQYANTWEGEFPVENLKADGYELLAPIKSYLPNDNGLYDITGNVWEWTSDWYNSYYYNKINEKKEIIKNPKGSNTPFNSNNPNVKEKVIKGGSFLCSASYCASYRVSARMATSTDSSMEHLGFRTVLSQTAYLGF